MRVEQDKQAVKNYLWAASTAVVHYGVTIGMAVTQSVNERIHVQTPLQEHVLDKLLIAELGFMLIAVVNGIRRNLEVTQLPRSKV